MRALVLVTFLGLLSTSAAQPCAFSLGPDQGLCSGSTVQLSAPGGMASYLWNSGDTVPTITVSAPGTYTCTITQPDTATNLIVNGDFSAGATGFTSDYILPTVPGVYGLLSNEGEYIVATDPILGHIDFASCGDHTTGTGNMLVVNGAAQAGENVWCQTIAVQANTTYSFSAWLMTAFPANPATLGFYINGVAIGAPLLASATTCVWLPFAATWNSGPATSATVCITNLNTDIFGNDFALDDILFTGFCSYTDTVVVSPASIALELGDTLGLCPGSSLLLDASSVSGQYLWNTGATSAQLLVAAAGTYSVIVDQGGCTAQDTVVVVALPGPQIELGPSVVLCPGDSALLAVAWPGATYLWSTGTTTATLEVFLPGLYSVAVTAGSCTATDSVLITIEPPLPNELLALDTLCTGSQIVLDASTPGALDYLWSTGGTGALITVQAGGTYTVQLIGSCEQRISTFVVVEVDCNTAVYVPNAFTPDGDGINEGFQVISDGPLEDLELTVFDRWGEEIFHSNSLTETWFGTYAGTAVPDGVYVWKLEYLGLEAGRQARRTLFGHVSVLH